MDQEFISRLGLPPFLIVALVVVLLWVFTCKQPELDAPLLINEDGDFSRIMEEGYGKV